MRRKGNAVAWYLAVCLIISALMIMPSVHVVIASLGKEKADSSLVKKDETTDSVTKAKVAKDYGKIPLHFIRNDGQIDKRVKYYEKGSGHAMYFTDDGVYLVLSRDNKERAKGSKVTTMDVEKREIETRAVRLTFKDGRSKPEVIAEGGLEGKVNYFIGNDPKKWRTDIPTYRSVLYKGVYKGIDIRFYGNQRRLEYDVIVKPGAEPRDVRLAYEGIDGLNVNERGELEVYVKGRDGKREIGLIQHKPIVYQEINGERREIEGRFEILKRESKKKRALYAFKVGEYDNTRPLIIDPVLEYSTYLGGSSEDNGHGIAVDSSGNAYVTGYTWSSNFPTQNAYQGTLGGWHDAFVTKLTDSPVPTNYTLTVTKSGTGSGTVTSSPSGIDCGSTCSASFSSGPQVELTTTSESGSVFAGWSGACSGSSTKCTVTMDASKNVTATFNTQTCTYSISPTSANFSSSGGTGSFNVTVPSSNSSSETSSTDELLMAQYSVAKLSTDTEKFAQYDSLLQKAAKDGSVRIIIKLNVSFKPEGLLSSVSQVDGQRATIAQRQDRVLASLSGHKLENIKLFDYIPFLSMKVDTAGLMAIYANSDVSGVYEDKLSKPNLLESVPLIQGNQAWEVGYTGSGQTVAILDTGVQTSHPFFGTRVVSEACYSTTDASDNSTSLCPNGQNEQTGAGSGINCSDSISGCDHGTHVAGIAAGSGSSFSGVAKGANIIAIQVFSRFNNDSDCGGNAPCVLSYASDQIKGLERVYALRNSYNISSVNMSIGGEKYTSNCDSSEAPRKAAIDNLRSAGIATVIASGNDGYSDGISSPACISTAVSVGSTTKSDTVSSFSNSATFLSLLAPGSSIYSSVTGSTYSYKSGTSMAAPHVAGAWAILKQKKPIATVTEILEALQNTGTSITDSRNGLVKPRINIKNALDVVSGGSCIWTAHSNASWISNINPSSGTGSAAVTYSVSSNPTGSGQRTGTISVAGQTFTITQTDSIFNDVSSSNTFYNYIMAIYNNGITVGCSQNPLAYCPSQDVTRGQMSAFIIRAKYGENFSYIQTPYYSDVPSSHNFFKYVQKLKDEGITVTTGTYDVNGIVTRGQMAAFIIRAKYGENFSYTQTPYYSDVPSGHNFFKYVQKLRDDGITVVTGTYGVDSYVTREMMSAFISRAFLGMR